MKVNQVEFRFLSLLEEAWNGLDAQQRQIVQANAEEAQGNAER